MELFKLFGRVLIDNDEANKSISKTETLGEKLGGTLETGIVTAAKFGAALVGAGTVAVGAMVGLVSKVGQTADRLLDLQAITGMTVDQIQRWEHVAKIAGVSTDAVTNASQRLTRQMETMSSETNKGNQAIRELGLSFDDISNMDADQRMDVLIKSLSEVENETHRAKLGTDLFGGAWKDIAPIVDMGAEAMDRAKASANVFSQHDLERANEMRIKFDLVKERAGFLALELGMQLLPIVEMFFDWVEQHMPQIEAFFKKAFEVAEQVITAVVDVVANKLYPRMVDFFNWIAPHLPRIQQFFKTTFETAAQVMQAVWKVVSQDLWPILRRLYEWVAPYLPMMQASFKTAFDGIYTSISNVIGIVKDAVQWFGRLIDAVRNFNREESKTPSSNFSTGSMQQFTDGSTWTPHAKGLSFVPYDGYKAELHKGERVLTAAENQSSSAQITNHFNIEQMSVRNDNDIKQIARELFELQKRNSRGVGFA